VPPVGVGLYAASPRPLRCAPLPVGFPLLSLTRLRDLGLPVCFASAPYTAYGLRYNLRTGCVIILRTGCVLTWVLVAF
jgi:hypothetical protein